MSGCQSSMFRDELVETGGFPGLTVQVRCRLSW